MKENKWWSADVFSPGSPKYFLPKMKRKLNGDKFFFDRQKCQYTHTHGILQVAFILFFSTLWALGSNVALLFFFVLGNVALPFFFFFFPPLFASIFVFFFFFFLTRRDFFWHDFYFFNKFGWLFFFCDYFPFLTN